MANYRRMSSDKLQAERRKERAQAQKIRDSAHFANERPTEAEKKRARDYITRLAEESKANLSAIDAELAARKAAEGRKFGSRGSDFVGMPSPLEQAKERDKRMAEQIAQHRQFMADLAKNGNAHAEEARELARAAGRLYEPIHEGGGLAVAAVFSSSVLWDFCDWRLNELPDDPGSYVMSQIVTGSQVLHLHWALCLIETMGGESCTVPGGTAPRWAGRDGNVNWSQSDMGHLRAVGFLDIKMEGGNMVISHGELTRELISGFLDMLAQVKK